MRIAIFMSAFIVGCSASPSPPKFADSKADLGAQEQRSSAFGPADIMVGTNSTTIDGEEIPRPSPSTLEVSHLLPLVQGLRNKGIADLIIHASPNTQAASIMNVVYALGQNGYTQVKIKTRSGDAELILPELGFQPDITIMLEPNGIGVQVAGNDLPSEPGCDDPGPTLCSPDKAKNLARLVELVNSAPKTLNEALSISLAAHEAAPTEELLDVLSLVAGAEPAVHARIALAVMR